MELRRLYLLLCHAILLGARLPLQATIGEVFRPVESSLLRGTSAGLHFEDLDHDTARLVIERIIKNNPGIGNFKTYKRLQGHKKTHMTTSIAWSPDGTKLASGSYDKTIIIWNASTGQPLRRPLEQNSEITSIAWSPNGRLLASGSRDGLIIMWDVATGQPLYRLQGHVSDITAIAWSPDGMLFASQPHSTPDDPPIKIWHAATGRLLHKLEGHSNVITSIAWSPDGTKLASSSWDHTAIIWSPLNGQEKLRISNNAYVMKVAWNRDGTRLASSATNGNVTILNPENGNTISALQTDTGTVGLAAFISWNPDGVTIATGTKNDTIIWNSATGKQIKIILNQNGNPLWSPDGAMLAMVSKGGNTIDVWSPTNWGILYKLKGWPTAHFRSTAWSPDSTRIASNSNDGIIIWDTPAKSTLSEEALSNLTIDQVLFLLLLHTKRPTPAHARMKPVMLHKLHDLLPAPEARALLDSFDEESKAMIIKRYNIQTPAIIEHVATASQTVASSNAQEETGMVNAIKRFFRNLTAYYQGNKQHHAA